jgi:hypothetical protein
MLGSLPSRFGRRCVGQCGVVSHFFSGPSSWQSSQQLPKTKKPRRVNKDNHDDGSIDDPTGGGGGGFGGGNANKQPFDKAIFEVGEWDPETRTNPLYRPKYTGTPRIISADDFARRPVVSFSGNFKGLEDGMVVLSWLDHKQQKDIYDLYVKMMLQSEKANDKITSHEYAVRKIASQVRMTEERVAAVLQLQHNEEQMRQAGIELNDDMAEYFDKGIASEFAAAYKMQKGDRDVTRIPPVTFVEDPVGVAGLQDTKKFVHIDDLIQINETDEHDAEQQRARQIIETHRYIEDIDEDQIQIPLDKNCEAMLQQATNMGNPAETDATVLAQRAKKKSAATAAPTGEGSKKKKKKTPIIAAAPPYRERSKNPRPRWRFVCQAVDSRKESYVNNCVKNTIVEQDGVLRGGTMADVRATSWKPIRHIKEFTYHGVKQAWLNRVNRNVMDGWGYARVKPPTSSSSSSSSGDDSASSMPTTLKESISAASINTDEAANKGRAAAAAAAAAAQKQAQGGDNATDAPSP